MSIGAAADASLNKKINTILADFGENINIGILVQDAKTGKVLYTRNADRYFMPASNQKLFTAFAALNYLGANFTYQTRLFVDVSNINNGTLNDNVYVQFSGDPTLTFIQLDHLMSALSLVGIKRIHGSVIVDDSSFDQVVMSPGTTWEDKDYCWGAPINTLIVDHNCVTAMLTPAATPDQPATLQLPDQPQFMQFVNQVVTGADNAVDCTVNVKATDKNTYTISGCIKAATPPKAIMMAIADPRSNTQKMLVYALMKNQITSEHGVEFKKVDKLPKLLTSQSSAPLTSLITTMLKESDNTIANALFKTIGATYAKNTGDWDNGNHAMHDILATLLQLNIPKTTLIDGAGGSRYNYFTPQQIMTLLRKVYLSNDGSIFMSALPIAGVDGTLKTRMTAVETLGKVHAKTGTATAVSALSGYVETKSNQTLIFSIMINNFVDLPSKYEALEDKICGVLVEA